MKSGKKATHSGDKPAARRRHRQPTDSRIGAGECEGIVSATVALRAPADCKADEPAHRIDLPPESTVRNAARLKDAMLGQLATRAVVTISLSAIERIDTSCLQLLVTFVRERGRNNRPVAWSGTSRTFSDAVALLGLAPFVNATGAV